jgi:hypothetical protein
MGLALPRIQERPGRILFARHAIGERNGGNGSKPARIAIFRKRCPERAEFFALPNRGP